MKKWGLSVVSVLLAVGVQAKPADLMQVYQKAVENDAIFQQAYATYQIARAEVPIQRAVLLPQIDLTGMLDFENQNNKSRNTEFQGITVPGSTTTVGISQGYQYELSLTQQIFNFTDWQNLAAAAASEKAAFATYTAAIQDLIVRTATAYFAVLKARDDVVFSKAEARAFYRQYEQAKESFEVGVKTRTDVENAKAAYDSARSLVVSTENTLLDKREDLRVITNTYYPVLQGLQQLPLVKPQPANMDAWVKISGQKSWQILSSQYNLLASHDNILSAEGGHLPTVNFSGSYSNEYNKFTNRPANNRQQELQAALNLNMPIYSGGQVSATVQQNIDAYRLASAQLEQTYREVMNGTRQSYLGAVSGISKVNADFQAVISNQSSVEGTEEGYKVGTQTMLDVLNTQKELYNAKAQYANDRYNYILSLITLKASAGTLSVSDVARINQWLISAKPIPPQPQAKPTASKRK